MDTRQVEVDAVAADKLPVEHPITYDQICSIVGALYLDGIRKSKGVEEQAKSLLNQLNDQLQSLREENTKLKTKLEEEVVE